MQILRAFKTHGAPSRRVRNWAGRWWTVWGATDLVPMGNRVLAAYPHFASPLTDASEIEVTGRDTGKIASASGYGSHGEPVRRSRNQRGVVTDIWLAGANLKRERAVAADIARRYGAPKPRRAR